MPNFLGTTLPKQANMWHDESTPIVGVAMVVSHQASQSTDYTYSSIGTSGTAANGDTWTNSFWVRAGTYTLTMSYVKLTTCGKFDMYLDGVVIQAAIDCYDAIGPTYNFVLTISGLVIATDGLHVLKGVTNGKNGGSTGYQITLTSFDLFQASY